MNNIKTTSSQIVTKLFFISLCILLGAFSSKSYASLGENDVVQYLNSDDTNLSGTLIPEPQPGIVPTSTTEFIEFLLDDNPDNVQLSPAGQGNATVKKTLSSIKEGRHSATLTTFRPNKTLLDNKQLLFFYDTTPPELTRVYPESLEISQYNLSFKIEFSDKGSGVPSLRKDMNVEATINGSPALVTVVADDSRRYLLIDYKGNGRVGGNASLTLFVSLKDRAGNEATLSETFTTPAEYSKYHFETMVCGSEDWKYDIISRMDWDFPITTRKGSVYLNKAPDFVVFRLAVDIGVELDDTILKKIKVTTDHPGVYINRISIENNAIEYRIGVKSNVNLSESQSFLKVEYPAILSLHYDWECQGDDQPPKATCNKVTVSEEKQFFQIPLNISWRGDTPLMDISLQSDNENNYYLQYEMWTDPGSQLLDTSASFLSLEGRHYFFMEENWRYTATAPVAKEGYYTFETTLVSPAGVWESTNTPIFREKYDFIVNMQPPEITSFTYNKEEERFEATFSDIGTPRDDLQINLSIEGFGTRDFSLSSKKTNHELVSPFPLPLSIVTAKLEVVDLAGNKAWRTCKVYGEPPNSTDPEKPNVTRYYVKPPKKEEFAHYDNPLFKNATISKLSDISNGFSNARVCTEERILARTEYIIPDPKDLEHFVTTNGASLVKIYIKREYYPSNGPYKLVSRLTSPFYSELFEGQVSPNFSWPNPYEHSLYSFELCENKVADILPPEVNNISFDPKTGKISARISDHGRPVSTIQTSLKCSSTIPKIYRNHSSDYDFSFRADPKPVVKTTKWGVSPYGHSEVKAPNYVVWNAVLESLKIQKLDHFRIPDDVVPESADNLTQKDKNQLWTVINIYRGYLQEQERTKNYAEQAKKTQINEHGLAGDFTAQMPLPPLQAGEVFDVTIYATDASGNMGSGTLSLTIPRYPPQVTLELVGTADSSTYSSRHGTKTTSHFNATAVDESGLDFNKMSFHVDNQHYSPLTSFGKGIAGGWVNGTTDTSFLNLIAGGQGYGQEVFMAQYGAALEEGDHHAVFKATDTIGMSSKAELDFSLEYPPFITDFVARPKAIQDAGGPAFTATILDRGENLDLSGITFQIDDSTVERSRLFYDPASGYFSVTGPLDYDQGYHSAVITAIDNNGHRAQEHIRFYAAKTITMPPGALDVSLDSITLWERKNHNSDGEANPGEFIRLFPTLLNTSPTPLESCRISLSSGDSRILIESPTSSAEAIQAGTTTTLVGGFDVKIDEGILETTAADPYEVSMQLHMSCEGTQEWEMPFSLPVFHPVIGADIDSVVSVELDRIPNSVTSGEFRLSGVARSSASYLENLEIHVNGEEVSPDYFSRTTGRFSVDITLVPGANVIEVKAYDESGATGYKTTFVNCISEVEVAIDRLPEATEKSSIDIAGSAESSASEIDHITLRVNGSRTSVNWKSRSNRFDATINLDEGMNLIEVTARDHSGAIGRDIERIRSTPPFTPPPPPFTPPSTTITAPNDGDNYQCNPIFVNGNYSTGSSTLRELSVTLQGGHPEECTVTSSDGGTFSAECRTNFIIEAGNYIIEAEVTTEQRVQATDTVIVFVGSCS